MTRIVEAKAVISAQDKTGGVFSSIARKVRMLERAGGMMSRAAPMLERANRATTGWTAGLAGAAGGLSVLGGAYVGAKIKDAVVDFAALERHMNRIALAGGASQEETTQAIAQVKRMSEDMKMPLDAAVSGLDALVASGKSMGEAMDFLPSVLATAQASGAATEDMARSASALATSLKVPAQDMQTAFDALVVGGNLGNFELKQMAEYLPKISASAQKLGFAGVDGTQRLVAMLQVVQKVSGTQEQAATGMTDAFEKLLSPTVLKAAQKDGLDFKKIMLDAQQHGENAFEAVLGKLRDLTKGSTNLENDLRLSAIFSEADSRRAIVGLIKNWNTYQEFLKQIRASQGAVAQQNSRILNDAQAQFDQASTKFNNSMLQVGQALMPVVSESIERIGLEIENFQARLQDIDDWTQRHLGFRLSDVGSSLQESTGLGGETNDQMRARLDREKAERANPALKRVNDLTAARQALDAAFTGDRQRAAALREAGVSEDRIAAGAPALKTYRERAKDLEGQLAQARMDAFEAAQKKLLEQMAPPPDLVFPAPSGAAVGAEKLPPAFMRDRRGRKIPVPMPQPAERGSWSGLLPPVGDDAAGFGPAPAVTPATAAAPVKAVVEGPVTAEVTGEANVTVRVQVDAAPELKAMVLQAIRAPMPLRSAPTGRSMPEAAPPTGQVPGP